MDTLAVTSIAPLAGPFASLAARLLRHRYLPKRANRTERMLNIALVTDGPTAQ